MSFDSQYLLARQALERSFACFELPNLSQCAGAGALPAKLQGEQREREQVSQRER